MIFLKSSCFYYGIFTDGGYRLMLSGDEANRVKNYVVDGQPPAVKQELFRFLCSELKRKNIPFDELCSADGIAGIQCGDFRITDSDFTADIKVSEKILLKNFQNGEYINGFNEEISNIIKTKEKNILRGRRFLEACKTVQRDLFRLEAPYINRTKINRFAAHTWQRITHGMKGHIGTEVRRYVTCLTSDGSELNMEPFDGYCEKMLVINDRTGCAAKIITERLRGYALGAGYDVISCPCTVNTDITEHLIIPELSFGVFTSKYYHRDDFENSRKIYAKRFMLKDAESIRQRTDFSLKAYRSLMNEVFGSLEKIKECDRRLNGIIYPATDMPALKNHISGLL